MVEALNTAPTGQNLAAKPVTPVAQTVELANPPPQGLAATSALIAATALGRDGADILLLQTPQGELALRTTLTLPPGAKVELRLQEGPPASVTILSVNGVAVRPAPSQALPSLPPAVLDLGTSLEATVLSPQLAGGRASIPAAADQATFLPPGTQLLLKVLGLRTPGESLPDSSGSEDQSPPPEDGISNSLPTGPQARPARPGSPLPERASTATPSFVYGQPPSQAAAPEARPFATGAPVMTGIILGPHPGGVAEETLIQTPAGLLAVAAKLAAPPGTEVRFERVNETRPASPSSLPTDQPLALGSSWPALDRMLDTLDRVAPDLSTLLRADFAAGGERLGAALLFFVGVLKGKPPWPGSAVDQTLEASGHKSLREQVASDLAELQGIAASPLTGDWQTYVLPLLAGPLIRPARLYVKRRKEDREQAAAEGEPNRFILEVDLSRLGPLQFDGLVRGMRFDLVLRSQRLLAMDLRREVSILFANTLGSVGYKGDISYVVERRFSVAPLDVLRPHLGVSA